MAKHPGTTLRPLLRGQDVPGLSGILRVSLRIKFHKAFSTPLGDESEMHQSHQSISIIHSNITGIHVPTLLVCPPRPMPNQYAWYQCYQQAPTAGKDGMAAKSAKSFLVNLEVKNLVRTTPVVKLRSPKESDLLPFCQAPHAGSALVLGPMCDGETSPSWLCRDEY